MPREKAGVGRQKNMEMQCKEIRYHHHYLACPFHDWDLRFDVALAENDCFSGSNRKLL